MLKAAIKCNPHVPAYLLGEKAPPDEPPRTIGFGDETEAVDFFFQFAFPWVLTRGAATWLHDVSLGEHQPGAGKKESLDRINQFKITLKGTRPLILRRIRVPETYTFFDLHVAIQDAMGWLGYHLHEFALIDPATGKKVRIWISDSDFPDDQGALPGWKAKIADYFSELKNSSGYTYDFGDGWEHAVKFEKALTRKRGASYPVCTAGKRACPPEDVGGVFGYEELLEIICDPKDEEYEEMTMWAGGDFDPDCFNPKEISFDDPGGRRKQMMSD